MSRIHAEIRMKRGHSFWATYQEASEVVDLDGLFNDYWSSDSHEFTVLSQSLYQLVHAHLIENPEGVVIGKHSGSLEFRFSASVTVRTFATAHPH